MTSRDQNWVASGSFDRTIKIWDMNRTTTNALVTLNPADASAPKSSVYALASDPFGRTIASGSPERVVRLWDPRNGKRTGQMRRRLFVLILTTDFRQACWTHRQYSSYVDLG